jgi:hypothetical protein
MAARRARIAMRAGWPCRQNIFDPRLPRHYVAGRQTKRLPRTETDVLNRYDRTPPSAGEAEIKYLDGDFRVVRPGAFVRCAVTGIPIPLEELKYWSVDLQEAYSTPEAVRQRLSGPGAP